MNAAAFAQLMLLGALWGAAFMFMRIAVPEFGALALAAARVGLALVIMAAVALVLRERLGFRRRWRAYLGVGAVNTALPFIAYTFAAQHIPAGYSAIANSTTPVWTALIAWLWFKERLGALKWLGIAFAFAGVVVLVGLQPVAMTPMALAGITAAVAAASLYGTAAYLIGHYLTRDEAPGQNVTQFASATGMVWGAAMWLLLPGLIAAPAVAPSAKAWGAVLALAVFCTAAGYALFFHLIKTIGPQRASSVAFLFPAFAAFWGWLILSEAITFNMVAGMAIVLIGTALVSMPNHTSGATTDRERVRDWLFWPLLYALGGVWLRRRIAARIMAGAQYFREETTALRANLPRYLPDADVEDACRDHRLTRLADRADVFLSTLRFRRTMRHDLDVHGLPPPGPGTMILFAHYGNGWWTLPLLAAQGVPVHLISAPLPEPRSWRERLWRPYLLLRWREMNRLGGVPLVTMRGASEHMRGVLRAGGRGLAAIDIPPVLARRTSPVAFLGGEAQMARRMIELAAETGSALCVFFGEVDRTTLRQRIDFEPIALGPEPAAIERAFADYAARLEARIRARPGLWHAWGDVDLYFAPSPAAEPA